MTPLPAPPRIRLGRCIQWAATTACAGGTRSQASARFTWTSRRRSAYALRSDLELPQGDHIRALIRKATAIESCLPAAQALSTDGQRLYMGTPSGELLRFDLPQPSASPSRKGALMTIAKEHGTGLGKRGNGGLLDCIAVLGDIGQEQIVTKAINGKIELGPAEPGSKVGASDSNVHVRRALKMGVAGYGRCDGGR